MALQIKSRRMKGHTTNKPFVYGSAAFWMGTTAHEEHTHRWTVYVRGLQHEDLSYFIQKVEFVLHESFQPPIRVMEKPPFAVTETGWGEFDVLIKVYFREIREPPISLTHRLKLFPKIKERQTMDVPVVSEHYDEFIFVDPTESFGKLLATPDAEIGNVVDPQLRQFLVNDEIVKEEQRQVHALQTGLERVNQQIEHHRSRLADAMNEISFLRARIHERIYSP